MTGWTETVTSLSVPSVQALAASFSSDESAIPDRYLRPDVVAEPVVADADIELPVVDLRRAELSEEERDKLGRACGEWGFFQLINHGVPEELIEKMKADIVEFFNLPYEEKKAFAQLPNSLEGYGQIFVKSEDQKLDWGDMMTLGTHPSSQRKMRFWPTHPPTFRDNLDEYSSAVKEVAKSLLAVMAKDLGLDLETMMDIFGDAPQAVRMNYYPPCPHPDKVLGHSPHSDATGLTILLQASDVQGLQIRKDGRWFPVDPLPGAFIVNVGDLLEIFTNGKYKSIEHRVGVDPEKERLSIAAFHAPRHDCTIRPLPQLVKGGVERYKSTSHGDYMKGVFSKKLHGKSHLESMKFDKIK